MSRSIFIIPGFAEGRWHTDILLRELEKLDYTKARDAATADIIVTHSAGCFFLPDTIANKQIVLINPPFWPGRPLVVSSARKLWGDFRTSVQRRKLKFFVRKITWNWIYIASNLVRVGQIGKHIHRQKFYEALHDKHVAIIRNDNDPWFRPDAKAFLPPEMDFQMYRLPGEHEDCWVYPRRHAELIDRIIGRDDTLGA